MRFLHSLLLLAASAAQAASSWGFDDASVVVGSKKTDRNVVKYVSNWRASVSLPSFPLEHGHHEARAVGSCPAMICLIPLTDGV